MDIHAHIVKLLDVLQQQEEPITRQQLAGQLTSAAGEDDNFWLVMTEKAVHEGLVKTKPAKSKTVAITPAGKKFRKNPTAIEVHPEENANDDELSMKLSVIIINESKPIAKSLRIVTQTCLDLNFARRAIPKIIDQFKRTRIDCTGRTGKNASVRPPFQHTLFCGRGH